VFSSLAVLLPISGNFRGDPCRITSESKYVHKIITLHLLADLLLTFWWLYSEGTYGYCNLMQ